jgi:Ca2+-binding EF-hand superfamily protein
MTPASGTATPRSGPAANPHCLGNFEAFDDDSDDRITRDEFGARPHADPDPDALFRERDRNADGSLTPEEFCSGFHEGSLGRTVPSCCMRRPGTAPMLNAGCEEHYEAFDSGGNGKLTLDEFAAWPHARGDAATLFEERDGNHDGTITREEFCSVWPRDTRP